MGSSQSLISTPSAIAIIILVGAIAYGFIQHRETTTATVTPSTPPTSASASAKKNKKKQPIARAKEVDVHPNPTEAVQPSFPGDFESPSATSDPSESVAKHKKKKKKAKKATTPVPGVERSSSARKPKKSSTPKPTVDTDGPWTRVEARRSKANVSASAPSDAGITTSVTGNSSPVTERTEDEVTNEGKKTLTEKLLPKPRKTGVEDMLETPDYPTVSRVMRVQPRPDEQPATGFSWGDYEDVDDSRGSADGEDGGDDGWGVVKSRGRSKSSKDPTQQPAQQKAPETLTKKQRQNAAKREAQKSAKADAESERRAALAKHNRELERLRIDEQYTSKSKKPSGGMTAFVDENGKMAWRD
ncbi:hypothetical protein A0H81_13181 [Grifola frondosa]|uniref:Uncharacterized protein n=1 Tax=Grifola frondosa TaxID=5627 RepID=A0A1C7LSI3_GRIFR|nr:hypothetical protein A0H81_13181 [Grifola frondosa]